ncbi:glycoside hydrolase family 28 protein [Biscogniauxia sp. FL1348]|nr:glycoside hydrolase family 28 protein [Biscogniauxia sp. FL1348]
MKSIFTRLFPTTLVLVLLPGLARSALTITGSTCTVTPLGDGGDDTGQILAAFGACGQDGTVVLTEGEFNVGRVMETTGLRNVDVEVHGTLRWSGDVAYWLRSSLPVEFAGRSTAWKLGGDGIRLRGFGRATFDGNGQLWYDQNRNQGNQVGRPISLTLWHATNVLVDGISWRQSQFWHTFVAYSENVTMTNLDMNSTSNSQWSTVNTDGVDTWNSKNVYISNWTVTCGDDCISMKGNSSNIHVTNVHCYESGCAVIGSMGSSASQPDYVSDVVFDNVTCTHSSNAAWIKTYAAGGGHVRNVTFANFAFDDVNQPIYVTPCIYTGQGCDASRLPITDVRWVNVSGTSRYNVAAAIHCSAAAPCARLAFENVTITPRDGGNAPLKYLCANIQDQDASGIPCTDTCPANWPQQLDGNR